MFSVDTTRQVELGNTCSKGGAWGGAGRIVGPTAAHRHDGSCQQQHLCPPGHSTQQCTAQLPHALASSTHLQQLLGQSDGDDAGGAAHARQVVRHDVGAHLEVVHNHGCGAWRRGAGTGEGVAFSGPEGNSWCRHAAASVWSRAAALWAATTPHCVITPARGDARPASRPPGQARTRQRGRGVEQGAVDDEDVHRLGLGARGLEHLLNAPKQHLRPGGRGVSGLVARMRMHTLGVPRGLAAAPCTHGSRAGQTRHECAACPSCRPPHPLLSPCWPPRAPTPC